MNFIRWTAVSMLAFLLVAGSLGCSEIFRDSREKLASEYINHHIAFSASHPEHRSSGDTNFLQGPPEQSRERLKESLPTGEERDRLKEGLWLLVMNRRPEAGIAIGLLFLIDPEMTRKRCLAAARAPETSELSTTKDVGHAIRLAWGILGTGRDFPAELDLAEELLRAPDEMSRVVGHIFLSHLGFHALGPQEMPSFRDLVDRVDEIGIDLWTEELKTLRGLDYNDVVHRALRAQAKNQRRAPDWDTSNSLTRILQARLGVDGYLRTLRAKDPDKDMKFDFATTRAGQNATRLM